MKKIIFMAITCLSFNPNMFSQSMQTETSLLWEVSGNGLTEPSYLFGTYHFLSNAFIDTIPAIHAAYNASDAVVGEVIIDSSVAAPMMEASMLQGTTLKQTLPDTIYTRAANWFSREAGIDMTNFDQFNPLTVMTIALAITQQKYYPNPTDKIQLDTYFQQKAASDGKEVMALETIQMQINAMYGQLTMERQCSLLYEAVREENGLRDLINIMNTAYVNQDLSELQALMYGSSYQQSEMKALLEDRNNYWMEQLPVAMEKQSLFVAVGALHLVGESGLVEQLRKLGYTVTPINITKQ